MKNHTRLIMLVIAFTVLLTLMSGGCDNITMTTIQGSGNVTTDNRSVSGISGVSVTTLGDLTISLGDTETLAVEGEDNLLPYLETNVRGGKLTIQTRQGTNIQTTKPMRYLLTVKNLESLSVTSSGNITAPALNAKRFQVEISSSGFIRLAGLTADSLQVRISSSGDLTVGPGNVPQQEITISSSGNYAAPDLQSQTATVTLSSSGNATIWVTERISGSLSSSGYVNYYGNPSVNVNTSSSGKAISQGNK